MRRFVLAAWLALALASGTAAAQAVEPIATAHGQYIAVLPTPWDGKSPRPLVLFLHGYGESATDIATSGDLVPAATKFGAVFVAPDGLGHGWSHVGAPQRRRDDIAFIHEVATEVERRWPIDRKRVYLSGFSIGGSMVWDVACHAPQGFAAFLPISGALWLPYPANAWGPSISATCMGSPTPLCRWRATATISSRAISSSASNGQWRAKIRIPR